MDIEKEVLISEYYEIKKDRLRHFLEVPIAVVREKDIRECVPHIF